jgi:hypothetical protein
MLTCAQADFGLSLYAELRRGLPWAVARCHQRDGRTCRRAAGEDFPAQDGRRGPGPVGRLICGSIQSLRTCVARNRAAKIERLARVGPRVAGDQPPFASRDTHRRLAWSASVYLVATFQLGLLQPLGCQQKDMPT